MKEHICIYKQDGRQAILLTSSPCEIKRINSLDSELPTVVGVKHMVRADNRTCMLRMTGFDDAANLRNNKEASIEKAKEFFSTLHWEDVPEILKSLE